MLAIQVSKLRSLSLVLDGGSGTSQFFFYLNQLELSFWTNAGILGEGTE